MKLNTVSK